MPLSFCECKVARAAKVSERSRKSAHHDLSVNKSTLPTSPPALTSHSLVFHQQNVSRAAVFLSSSLLFTNFFCCWGGRMFLTPCLFIKMPNVSNGQVCVQGFFCSMYCVPDDMAALHPVLWFNLIKGTRWALSPLLLQHDDRQTAGSLVDMPQRILIRDDFVCLQMYGCWF